jgi:16S rRNA (guanine(966)-N(2))-methyltransferase RsmD
MRIISGKYGGRKIHPPANMPFTRPTTDIAKEGLFNILQNNLDFTELKTLDLFGGTGCISYELASRGCSDLTIIEQDEKMFRFIQKNIVDLHIENAKLYKMDVFKFIQQCNTAYDFIFAGPPYALNTIDSIPDLIFEKKMLEEDGWFVLEHTPRNDYTNHPFFHRVKNYGTTLFTFFVNS